MARRLHRRQRRPVAPVGPGAGPHRAARSARLVLRPVGQRLQHRRRAPAKRCRTGHGQPQAHAPDRRRPAGAAVQHPRAARRRPARPVAHRIRRQPAPDHAQRAGLRHPQDRAPDPARRRVGTPPERRAAAGADGLAGPARCVAIPGHPARRADRARLGRRRDRPGPRLWRRPRALAARPPDGRRHAGSGRRPDVGPPARAARRLRELHRPAAGRAGPPAAR